LRNRLSDIVVVVKVLDGKCVDGGPAPPDNEAAEDVDWED
jgi:hypothetical protein